MGKSLQELANEAELTSVQLSSKIYRQLLDVAAGESISEIKTIERECDSTDKRIESINRELKSVAANLSRAETRVNRISTVIDDKATMNGLMAYREVLQATLDVFGEDRVTESVAIKAIEAASYCAWRSIMGPKGDSDGRAVRL